MPFVGVELYKGSDLIGEKPSNSDKSYLFYYEQVLPNEAVLVQVLHPIFDNGNFYSIKIVFESAQFGKLRVFTPGGRDYVDREFIWDNGEYGSPHFVEKLEN